MIDYRKILYWYIDFVGSCEGVDYLPARLAELTLEENIALHEVAAEGATLEHRQELFATNERWEWAARGPEWRPKE